MDINNDRTGVTEKHAYRRMFDDRIDFTFYVDASNYLRKSNTHSQKESLKYQ